MKIFSQFEILSWCTHYSIPIYKNKINLNNLKLLQFRIPSDAGKRIYKTKELFERFKNETEILIWITEWSIWPSGERIHIFDRFRLSYGETAILIEKPGHIYNNKEYEDALSLCTICTLFLWDCYVVNNKFDKVLFFSHDEIGYQSIEKK